MASAAKPLLVSTPLYPAMCAAFPVDVAVVIDDGMMSSSAHAFVQHRRLHVVLPRFAVTRANASAKNAVNEHTVDERAVGLTASEVAKHRGDVIDVVGHAAYLNNGVAIDEGGVRMEMEMEGAGESVEPKSHGL